MRTITPSTAAKRSERKSVFGSTSPSLAALHASLIMGLFISVLPVLWTVSASFKPVEDIFRTPPVLIPEEPQLSNYARLFEEAPFWRWLANSIVLAVIATVAVVFFSALAGYGFAKFRFPGRNTLFSIMISALMIPFGVILVPLFIEMAQFGWTDSYLALVIPWMAPPFGIFMMRQFIVQSVPDEIIGSARVDGATEFAIFRRIVIPIIKPALGALAVWNFLFVYNSFLWPLTVISSTEKYTIPLGLNALFGNFNREYGMVMAGATLACLPTIIIFVLLRKQLLSGLTVGAVKG